MRRSYRILPVYTGDVSGACSALYELGGMTVMHDPSGCNSTYNTHDELRWYEQDSLIFSSGLTDRDAVLGNDQKFLDDVAEAAREFSPRFLALVGSQIPYLNGTDLPALARILERELDIPSFALPTNGMHDYVSGAGRALEEIARRFVIPTGAPGEGKSRERCVNLLGVTPLDFGPAEQVQNLRENLGSAGWTVNTVWAMGSSLDDLQRSGQAAVNLVVSSVGLRAARLLWREWQMPYVVGTPWDGFTGTLAGALEEVIREPSAGTAPMLRGRLPGPAAVTLIGEPVTSGSLAVLLERRWGRAVRVLCPLEHAEGLLTPNDRPVRGEEELEEALTGTQILVADPLYRPVCPPGCRFVEWPHPAFSGRIYAGKLPDIGTVLKECE